jgi:hypothetical protein
MGKMAQWIDGAALGLVAYAASFLYFLYATGQAWAAALMAAPLSALAAWAYARHASRIAGRRERAKRARAAVERLALLPEAEARAMAERYANLTGALLQRHPKGRPLDADEVLSLWRGASGEMAEIATTGPVSDGAWAAAAELTSPKVQILDAKALAARFEKSKLPLDAPPAKKRKISVFIPRKRAKHCAIYGCAMLGVYILTGLWTYLAAAVILLGLMSLALRRRAASPG